MAAPRTRSKFSVSGPARAGSHGLAGLFGYLVLVVGLAGCTNTGSPETAGVATTNTAASAAASTAPRSISPETTSAPPATQLAPAPSIPVGTGPHRMVEVNGTVWLSTDLGEIVGVDAATGAITHRIATRMLLSGIAAANGRVWVAASQEGLLLEIDPATDTIAGQMAVGGALRGLTAVSSELWVAVGDQGQLVRVDAATRTVTGSTPTGPSPAQIAVTKAGCG